MATNSGQINTRRGLLVKPRIHSFGATGETVGEFINFDEK
jgi:hypothetical protein